MKKIGIIYREYEHFVLNKELCNFLTEKNYLVIGILPNNHYQKVIAMCDGVVLQGGTDYTEKDLEIVRYLWKKNIPTLGICLGMQMMSVSFGKELKTLNNHSHDQEKGYVHSVNICKNSRLYEIIKEEKMMVNSRHQEYVTETNLSISAISSDFVIEAVEDRNKTFFIGVQWHPESIIDPYSERLWNAFFQHI